MGKKGEKVLTDTEKCPETKNPPGLGKHTHSFKQRKLLAAPTHPLVLLYSLNPSTIPPPWISITKPRLILTNLSSHSSSISHRLSPQLCILFTNFHQVCCCSKSVDYKQVHWTCYRELYNHR